MAQKEQVDYKKLQAELDALLEKMQRDDIDIDEAVQAYERGMEIVQLLEKYLATAENRITKLQAKFEV